ncbi:NAD(P)H-dependent flavin oxidoreductase [Bosea psychrotolerans]|uniref:Nitronate monooxygenase n=1 Tax=Bosea psychrotolerans TaxID=1871628 RepID=A0A2S4MDF0_9HYPH|nr:nitronate monooxygenase [Bosea psychrotolerans]POR52645.1 nitronate monooxygenase [Bosea psychrotolerans]
MWNDTEAARLLGITYPIVQGPFGGGLSSVELTAAVSNLGGLGSFGAHIFSPVQIRDIVAHIRERTASPFAINLWVDNEDPAMAGFDQASFECHVGRLHAHYAALGLDPPAFPDRFGQNFDEQIEALIEVAPPVISFVFGIPSPRIIEACRSRGIRMIGNATTVEEARAIEAAGIDLVLASGAEAGGHRVSFLEPPERSLVGTFALIPQVRDAVRIPVVAAGGIADGRGVATAMALGADGVQVGTAFLACSESGASSLHRAALLSDRARHTTLTRAFSGRLARAIRNRYSEDMAAYGDDLAPYPAQNWLTNSLRAAAIERGRDDLLPIYAGQSAALLRHATAGALFDALIRETGQAFRTRAVR